MLAKIVKFFLLALVVVIGYLALSSTELGIEPTELPKFQLKQQLKDIPNLDLDRLKNAQYIQLPKRFVEDVAVAENGDIYAIAGSGPSDIYRIDHRNYSIQVKLGQTPGRALGTALNKAQTLLAFIDQKQGLRILNLQTNTIKTVATHYKTQKFISINSVTFTNNPDLIFFTHSCDFSMTEYHYELLYKTGRGQVFQLNINTGQMRIVLDGIQFSNGITYDQKEDCLYVVELNYYRVIRIDLGKFRDNKPIQKQVVIDNLIGYPDNIKITQNGHIWIAIPSLRDKANIFMDNHPILRKILINANLPESLFLSIANMSYVGGIKFDPHTGKIIDYLFGKPNRIQFVTGILQRNGKVYLASLKENVIAVVDYL